ncbi:MAG: hypothetical protein PWP76_533 [Candidatus Diapherotrites archaeon]|nr:hypothetical protein [Candidatus Diapherotrites archaeon]MDN5367169.1 hypothetical protein [Candidatus Diapherotrites archaeon]
MRGAALVILVALVVGLTVAGFPWAAVILAFGGALAIIAMPPAQPRKSKEWSDLPPVPEPGSYPGWDFWVKNIQDATKTAMDFLRQFTGIHYAADDVGDKIKKKIWDADVPTELRWNPYIGVYWAHKKTSDAIILQMYQRILLLQQQILKETDPDRRKELKKELDDLIQKFNDYVKDNKL